MRSMTVAVVSLALLAACGGDGEGGGQEVGVACETVRSIAATLGDSMQGPYASTVLTNFVTQSSIVVPGGGNDCDRNIANALVDACSSDPCNGGWAIGGQDLEFCMLRVEAAFYTPWNGCAACGDGVCSLGDDCAEDCHCGNGICETELSENELFCSQDCDAACGDGYCTMYEYCLNEMPDGWVPPEVVEPAEGEPPLEDEIEPFVQCDIDCCNVRCGDGVCVSPVETAESCEQDCSVGYCGDGLCFGSEDSQNCRADCPYFVCRGDECPLGGHCFNCPDGCADPAEVCGDGVCRGCEVISCAGDCANSTYSLCPIGTPSAECPPGSCGDGQCDWGAENQRTCPMDCDETGGACGFDAPCAAGDVSLNCRSNCTPNQAAAIACGDGYCDVGENGSLSPSSATWYECPADCGGGACQSGFYACLCGNGQCEPWEVDETPCPMDCEGAP